MQQKENITRALFLNTAKGNNAMDARYRGYADALNETAGNMELLEELAIDPFTEDGKEEGLSVLEQALEGCSYDVILIGGSVGT